MRVSHALTALGLCLSPIAGLAVEPVQTPPPPPQVRENEPRPIVRAQRPPKEKKGARFVQRRLARPFPGEGTPLVFALDQHPALTSDGRSFSFEPGAPMRSSWPAASVAWLVRDLDRDGQISTGRELFGTFTAGGYRNGFEALAALDGNHDGQVDARDAAFSELQLWFDRDGDRQVSTGELVPVDFALPTSFTSSRECNARGDCIVERAKAGAGWLLDLHLVLESVPRT
ncbi:MAG: hypothetical protein U0228_15380 [Myxococcaceae bacterium]